MTGLSSDDRGANEKKSVPEMGITPYQEQMLSPRFIDELKRILPEIYAAAVDKLRLTTAGDLTPTSWNAHIGQGVEAMSDIMGGRNNRQVQGFRKTGIFFTVDSGGKPVALALTISKKTVASKSLEALSGAGQDNFSIRLVVVDTKTGEYRARYDHDTSFFLFKLKDLSITAPTYAPLSIARAFIGSEDKSQGADLFAEASAKLERHAKRRYDSNVRAIGETPKEATTAGLELFSLALLPGNEAFRAVVSAVQLVEELRKLSKPDTLGRLLLAYRTNSPFGEFKAGSESVTTVTGGLRGASR
jgi:hypothetical protein